MTCIFWPLEMFSAGGRDGETAGGTGGVQRHGRPPEDGASQTRSGSRARWDRWTLYKTRGGRLLAPDGLSCQQVVENTYWENPRRHPSLLFFCFFITLYHNKLISNLMESSKFVLYKFGLNSLWYSSDFFLFQ